MACNYNSTTIPQMSRQQSGYQNPYVLLSIKGRTEKATCRPNTIDGIRATDNQETYLQSFCCWWWFVQFWYFFFLLLFLRHHFFCIPDCPRTSSVTRLALNSRDPPAPPRPTYNLKPFGKLTDTLYLLRSTNPVLRILLLGQ